MKKWKEPTSFQNGSISRISTATRSKQGDLLVTVRQYQTWKVSASPAEPRQSLTPPPPPPARSGTHALAHRVCLYTVFLSCSIIWSIRQSKPRGTLFYFQESALFLPYFPYFPFLIWHPPLLRFIQAPSEICVSGSTYSLCCTVSIFSWNACLMANILP